MLLQAIYETSTPQNLVAPNVNDLLAQIAALGSIHDEKESDLPVMKLQTGETQLAEA